MRAGPTARVEHAIHGRRALHGHIGAHALHGSARPVEQRGKIRRTRCAQHEHRRVTPPWHLRGRVIPCRLRAGVRRSSPRHPRTTPMICTGPNPTADPSANRVLSGQVALGQRFVDHDHVLTVSTIGFIEEATIAKLDSHRREVGRRAHTEIGEGLLRLRRAPIDDETIAAATQREEALSPRPIATPGISLNVEASSRTLRSRCRQHSR